MSAEPLSERFARAYRGRHRPEDALWWLTHPDAPGPSSARPVQELFLTAADELERAGDHASAQALLESLAQLLHLDQQYATDALRAAEDQVDSINDQAAPDINCEQGRPEH